MKLSIVSTTVVASLFAGSVQAHAHLEKSTPAEGSTLSVAPAVLEMTFSEAARLTALSIQSDREARQAIKELPAAAGKTLRIALPPLAPGVYTLAWRVIAADGHVSSGVVHFTISPVP